MLQHNHVSDTARHCLPLLCTALHARNAGAAKESGDSNRVAWTLDALCRVACMNQLTWLCCCVTVLCLSLAVHRATRRSIRRRSGAIACQSQADAPCITAAAACTRIAATHTVSRYALLLALQSRVPSCFSPWWYGDRRWAEFRYRRESFDTHGTHCDAAGTATD